METTPQNTQPQGQDKLVLKSTFGNEPQEPNPVAPQLSLPSEGAISDLLSPRGQVFGNTDLISAAKIELACIQEELLKKPQEVKPQLDFNDVELRTDIQEILESDHWFETVYIGYPSDMQVDCSGCDITVSDVEGEVEVSMSQGQAEVMAEKIMDFLEKRTKDA
jgi:hypothetical protein